tara:strand:+ start:1213 stop:1476 length:264 start_codon:yes stop_codon:yes gene_type:complete
MFAKLLAITSSIILLLATVETVFASLEYNSEPNSLDKLELPAALLEDDSFGELPFEQLRQALREEVERDPSKEFQPSSPKQYNFLIR